MRNLHFIHLSSNEFLAACFLAGLVVLIASWRTIISKKAKKRNISRLLCILSLSLIILPVILFFIDRQLALQSQSNMHIPSPEVIVTKPVGIPPFPGGDTCSTSGATGATAT